MFMLMFLFHAALTVAATGERQRRKEAKYRKEE